MTKSSLKKIGEVANQLGTTPRTLRFYEEVGLVSSRRTSGGTRLYSSEDILRFQAILRLAETGIPISLIKDLACTRQKFATGEQASQNVQTIITSLKNKLAERALALSQLQTELSTASQTIKHCFNCPNPPTRQGCPNCPMNQQLDVSGIINLIWEQNLDPE